MVAACNLTASQDRNLITKAHKMEIAEQASLSKWEIFLAMEQADKIETFLMATSPALVAIIGTICLMSSVRKIFELKDKSAFVVGILMSSLLGIVATYVLKDQIHTFIGFEFYIAPQCYVAALFLTPVLNHIVFKFLMVILFVMYQYSKNEKRLFQWFPYRSLSMALYKMFTGNDLVQKKDFPEGVSSDQTVFRP